MVVYVYCVYLIYVIFVITFKLTCVIARLYSLRTLKPNANILSLIKIRSTNVNIQNTFKDSSPGDLPLEIYITISDQTPRFTRQIHKLSPDERVCLCFQISIKTLTVTF